MTPPPTSSARRLDEVAVGARSTSGPASAGQNSSSASATTGQRVQPKRERGGDAEVAAAAVQRPEQLRVLVLAGASRARRRRSPARPTIRLSQASPNLRSSQPEPPPRVKPADAGGRHPAAGRGQPVRLGGAVEVAPWSRRRRPWRCARSGSTATAFIRRRSMTRPPSIERHARRRCGRRRGRRSRARCSRANAIAAATSVRARRTARSPPDACRSSR